MQNIINIPLAKIAFKPGQSCSETGHQPNSEQPTCGPGSQPVPALVGQPVNGIYPLLDGERRYQAAKQSGAETLLCAVE